MCCRIPKVFALCKKEQQTRIDNLSKENKFLYGHQ